MIMKCIHFFICDKKVDVDYLFSTYKKTIDYLKTFKD